MKKLIPIVLLLINCTATGVKVQMYSPAKHVLWGLKNIVIADIYGEKDLKDEIRSQLESAFANTDFFNCYDSGLIQTKLREAGYSNSDLTDISKIKEVGQALDADGLIYLKIDSCKVFPDEKGAEQIQKRIWTGKYQRDELGNILEEEVDGEIVKKKLLEVKLVEQKYTIRKGMVAMEFMLADGNSGSLALVERIEKKYDSGKVPDEQMKSLPSEMEILTELSQQVINEFIELIKPRLKTVRRPLSTGVHFVEEGLIYAQDGMWQEAIDAWLKAVQNSPNDAGIQYNIGVAYEALREYEKAEEYYRRAQLISDEEPYQKALDKIAGDRNRKSKKLTELLEKYPPARFLKQKEIEQIKERN
ncbi:tetratricopeptide repeat protein [candidate division KSB1 bacterium]|nr:tetratricopeptide repeat protein [candidate division KSB1 bacterium]